MRSLFALAILATLAITLPACSSSRLQTATRPAQPPSVNAITDSIRLEQLPPVPARGVPTRPVRVTRYDSLPAPAAGVQRITYAPGEALSVLLGSGVEMEYEPPVVGETFDWVATSDSSGRAQVRGRPESEEVDVVAPEPRRSVWDRALGRVQGLFAAVGLLALIWIGVRFLTR